MNVGFTGTRHGMSEKQVKSFTKLIKELPLTEFHHGDCIGADNQVHAMVRTNRPDAVIVIHPPSNSRARAWCAGDETKEPQEYLPRNRAIVNGTELLIATPGTEHEVQRSGTWVTVRYARKLNKQIVILEP